MIFSILYHQNIVHKFPGNLEQPKYLFEGLMTQENTITP